MRTASVSHAAQLRKAQVLRRCALRAAARCASSAVPERFQWKGAGSQRQAQWEELALAGRGGYVTDSAGAQVFFLDEGPEDGQTVVLLHGFPSHSYVWRNVAPALAAGGFRVVALDLPGFGASSKPEPAAFGEYSLERFAATLQEVLFEALQLKSVRLVGQGWTGGLLAALIAARRPDDVSSLVLLNVPLTKSLAEAVPPPLAFLLNPLVGAISAQNPMALLGAPLEKGAKYRLAPDDMAAYIAPALGDANAGWAAIAVAKALRAGGAAALEEALALLEPSRVSLVWGVDDPWLGSAPPADVLPGARRLLMPPGAGHWAAEDWPAKTAELLLDCLATAC